MTVYDQDWAKAEEQSDTVLPLGTDTDKAAALFREVRPKIDDYFTRCRLAAFDERAARVAVAEDPQPAFQQAEEHGRRHRKEIQRRGDDPG